MICDKCKGEFHNDEVQTLIQTGYDGRTLCMGCAIEEDEIGKSRAVFNKVVRLSNSIAHDTLDGQGNFIDVTKKNT